MSHLLTPCENNATRRWGSAVSFASFSGRSFTERQSRTAGRKHERVDSISAFCFFGFDGGGAACAAAAACAARAFCALPASLNTPSLSQHQQQPP